MKKIAALLLLALAACESETPRADPPQGEIVECDDQTNVEDCQ